MQANRDVWVLASHKNRIKNKTEQTAIKHTEKQQNTVTKLEQLKRKNTNYLHWHFFKLMSTFNKEEDEVYGLTLAQICISHRQVEFKHEIVSIWSVGQELINEDNITSQ